MFVFIAGFLSLFWILIRVFPKPTRATYPCMQVAVSLASGCVLYLTGISISALFFLKAGMWLREKRYWIAALGIAVAGLLFLTVTRTDLSAQPFYETSTHSVLDPMGIARGIFPGRVVWVHDSTAVNQNCVVDKAGDGWFFGKNMNQPVVDRMFSSAIGSVTGKTSDSAAWKAIFEFHNSARGKGAVNYVKGERVFIKINATSAWSGNFKTSDLSCTASAPYYGVSETSVAAVLAVLRQLVNVVGVAQSDIHIGDPIRHIYKHLYDVWHGEFPDIHYLDNSYSTLGREKALASSTARIVYSDRGSVLRTNQMNPGTAGVPVYNDYLYSIFATAEYVLNVPMLKGHQRAGVTMFAKNHFGSHTRADASHLHMGLVRPYGASTDTTMRRNYGMYRVQVDLMTGKYSGGKNLLYIMDALWATSYELDIPRKWKLAPFNNAFMSSLFVSQDPVAIESVGYDFLRSEFTAAAGQDASVQMPAVDDYLHQAADSLNWPAGIQYDPDSTGVHIKSLGVHEHWNNSAEKKYSRNVGTGNGIELITIDKTTGVEGNTPAAISSFILYDSYPNPFNPIATIQYDVAQTAHVTLTVYDAQGRIAATLVDENKGVGRYTIAFDGSQLSSGVYFYVLSAGKYLSVRKAILLR
jgi:hypothetical protein